VSIETSHEWAVRVQASIGDVPGPHTLECLSQGAAEARFDWWRSHRPEAEPELLRRTVTITREPWEVCP
jgi:hypothetical protein